MPLKRNFDFGIYDPNICWAPHPEEVYAIAKIKEKKDDSATVEDSEGTSWTVKASEILTFDVADMLDAEDAASLKNLQEACLLDVVKRRYDSKKIYTNTTRNILIAVNPYEQLPLYTPEMFKSYRGYEHGSHAPHIFGVADTAFQLFMANRKSQSIIISGESGSGKSESTKLIVRYLSQIGGRVDLTGEVAASTTSGKVSVESRIVESAPLLEAFGNAKTMQNNNSSRFGKFIKVFFDSSNTIYGAHILHTLLEKSRIVMPGKGERNYHIFYQLCAGAPEALKTKLKLTGGPKSFRYLAVSDTVSVEGVDDAHNFEHTKLSMTICDVSPAEQDAIWNTLAALLHLGNVEFMKDKGDGSEVKNVDVLTFAASLLQVDVAKLKDAITKRAITVGKDVTFVLLNPDTAASTRDAFVKSIYSLLFDWLVERINRSMTVKDDSLNFIGVLDIFGFEIFQKNSLEQLHINWANESLQQQFNATMFKTELKECDQEGIVMSDISFQDNEECLELIEKKIGGVLSILDEACVLPKSTDTTFLDQVNKTLVKHPCFVKPRVGAPQFGIKHFAGPVMYTVEGFLQKNTDKVNENLLKLIKISKDKFLQTLFGKAIEDFDKSQSGPGTKSSANKITTVSANFKIQLQGTLIKTLAATEPHYVRCIKPNPNKLPSQFVPALVHQQLKCSGVLEVIRLRRTGYPVRIAHSDLTKKYFVCTPMPKGADDATGAKHILEKVVGTNARWQSGKTKVFLSVEAHTMLDRLREETLRDTIIKLQTYYRMYDARKNYKKTCHAILRIQLRVRIFLARLRHKRRVRATTVFQKNWRKVVARRAYLRSRNLVILIQKNVKRHQTRNKFRKIVRLMTILQKDTRRYLARTSFKRLKAAATAFSKTYRMHKEVVAYRKSRARVILLQKLVRGWIARRAYNRMRKAAIAIQATYRRHHAVQTYLKTRRAIVNIQRMSRGHCARLHFSRDKRLMVKLQSCIRRHQALTHFRRVRNQVILLQSIFRTHAAVARFRAAKSGATQIQRIARGYLARKEYTRARNSVITIQKTGKMFVSRQKYMRDRRSVILLQSLVRAWLAKTHYASTRSSAIKIQSAWRMHSQKSDYSRIRTRVTNFQSMCRTILARRDLDRQRSSAIVIQTAYRNFEAKLRLDHAKEEARQKRIQERAAERIQKTFKGHVERKRYVVVRDAERARKAEEERLRKEEEERARLEAEEAERKRLEEVERQRLEAEEAERKRLEEIERQRLEAEEEAERKRQQEELERQRLDEEERQQRLLAEEAEERKRVQEEEIERKRKEEEEEKERQRQKEAAEQKERERIRLEEEAERKKREEEDLEAAKKKAAEQERLERERLEEEEAKESERKVQELQKQQQEQEAAAASALKEAQEETQKKLDAERLERQIAQLEAEKLEAERQAEVERQRLEAEKEAQLAQKLAELEREKEEAKRLAEEEHHNREEAARRLQELEQQKAEAIQQAEQERQRIEAEKKEELSLKIAHLEVVRQEAEVAKIEAKANTGMAPDLAVKLARRRSRMESAPPAQFANLLLSSQPSTATAEPASEPQISSDLAAKLAKRKTRAEASPDQIEIAIPSPQSNKDSESAQVLPDLASKLEKQRVKSESSSGECITENLTRERRASIRDTPEMHPDLQTKLVKRKEVADSNVIEAQGSQGGDLPEDDNKNKTRQVAFSATVRNVAANKPVVSFIPPPTETPGQISRRVTFDDTAPQDSAPSPALLTSPSSSTRTKRNKSFIEAIQSLIFNNPDETEELRQFPGSPGSEQDQNGGDGGVQSQDSVVSINLQSQLDNASSSQLDVLPEIPTPVSPKPIKIYVRNPLTQDLEDAIVNLVTFGIEMRIADMQPQPAQPSQLLPITARAHDLLISSPIGSRRSQSIFTGPSTPQSPFARSQSIFQSPGNRPLFRSPPVSTSEHRRSVFLASPSAAGANSPLARGREILTARPMTIEEYIAKIDPQSASNIAEGKPPNSVLELLNSPKNPLGRFTCEFSVENTLGQELVKSVSAVLLHQSRSLGFFRARTVLDIFRGSRFPRIQDIYHQFERLEFIRNLSVDVKDVSGPTYFMQYLLVKHLLSPALTILLEETSYLAECYEITAIMRNKEQVEDLLTVLGLLSNFDFIPPFPLIRAELPPISPTSQIPTAPSSPTGAQPQILPLDPNSPQPPSTPGGGNGGDSALQKSGKDLITVLSTVQPIAVRVLTDTMLKELQSSVAKISQHFAKKGPSSGDELFEPRIGILVVNDLCNALLAILKHSLKTRVFLFSVNLWDFVTNVVTAVEKSDLVGGLRLREAIDTAELMTERKATASAEAISDLKFKTFVCYALNYKALSQFMSKIFQQTALMAKHYEPNACSRNADVQQFILDCLVDISTHSFSLKLEGSR